MTTINNKRLKLGRWLKHSMSESFQQELSKYKAAGFRRPDQGFPKESLTSLVLYDGMISSEEAGHADRGYEYNWKVKGVLWFGEAIVGVCGDGGKGQVSGTKPLSWWGFLGEEKGG